MELNDGDFVIDMAVIKEGTEVITMTENGYGKRSDLDDYRQQNRGGKGVKAGVFNDKTGKLVSLKLVSEGDDIMIITSNGTIIRVASGDISKIGRDTQGVRIMRIDDSTVSKIALTPKSDEDLPEDGEAVDGENENQVETTEE
jgi:DNA gyrase subunit A